jgi:hypothetical protein
MKTKRKAWNKGSVAMPYVWLLSKKANGICQEYLVLIMFRVLFEENDVKKKSNKFKPDPLLKQNSCMTVL